jgi:hypothetical protein
VPHLLVTLKKSQHEEKVPQHVYIRNQSENYPSIPKRGNSKKFPKNKRRHFSDVLPKPNEAI